MSHTYATVAAFKDYIVEDGNADLGNLSDTRILSILESASRRIDAYCNRTLSGFGPRTGTNTYDSGGESGIYFNDDLLTAGTVSAASYTGQTPVVLVANTDYLLYPANEARKRRIEVSGLGVANFGAGSQVFTVNGTWGYSNTTVGVGSIGTVTSSATTFALSGGSAYAGATLLVDSEQVYVTASTGGTALTVVRGQNGTTAAVHAASAAAAAYVYPSEIVTACLLVGQRRWRQKEAGIVGDLSGGNLPFIGNRDNELSILRATVGHLRVYDVVG